MISLKSTENRLDIRYGFARLSLDTTELNNTLIGIDKKVNKIVRSKEVLMAMAKSVIYAASDANIIPEKPEYQLRKAKSTRKMRDADGNVVVYKSGDKKGQPRYLPFSPSQYYSYITEEFVNKPQYDTQTIKGKGNWSMKKRRYTKNKRGDLKVSEVTGYETVTRRKRVYWRDTSPENFKGIGAYAKFVTGGGETYRSVISYESGTQMYKTIINSKGEKVKVPLSINEPQGRGKPPLKKSVPGKVKKRTRWYKDRSPHLTETEDTHITRFKKNVAQIIIKAKKPKDKKFIDIGGVQYGAAQYYGPDKDWKRTTENTTSRWLEVAIDEPVPDNVKITSIPVAQTNRENMIKIMEEAIRKELNNG